MKKYISLSLIFSLWDIIILLLYSSEEVLHSIEASFLLFKDVSTPNLSHRLLALTLISIIIIFVKYHDGRIKIFRNMINSRLAFNRMKKIRFYAKLIFKDSFIMSSAKLTADCLFFFSLGDLFIIFKMNLLFILFVIEIFLISSMLNAFKIAEKIYIISFIVFSMFVPDFSVKKDLFYSCFTITNMSFYDNFFNEVIIKIVFISITFCIYLYKEIKNEDL